MKYFISIFIATIFFSSGLSQSNSYSSINWNQDTTVSPGIKFKSFQGELEGIIQSISVVVIYKADKYDFNIIEFDTLTTLPVYCSSKKCLVAINSSFFNMKDGGSVVFVQEDGSTKGKFDSKNKRFIDQGAILKNIDQSLNIIPQPEKGWDKMESVEDALVTGPILLLNNIIQKAKEDKFHENRHPRSAIGLDSSKNIYMVTVDGRNRNAHGMTISELSVLLKYLGCVDALNLDGGGSTTLYVDNFSENGVVNYPSDNMNFDHKGARKIANAIIITSKDQK